MNWNEHVLAPLLVIAASGYAGAAFVRPKEFLIYGRFVTWALLIGTLLSMPYMMGFEAGVHEAIVNREAAMASRNPFGEGAGPLAILWICAFVSTALTLVAYRLNQGGNADSNAVQDKDRPEGS